MDCQTASISGVGCDQEAKNPIEISSIRKSNLRWHSRQREETNGQSGFLRRGGDEREASEGLEATDRGLN